MAAAADGAGSAEGLSIGVLPGADRSDAAPSLTASLATGLGEARNVVLVTAADGVIACGMSPGTLSEIALAAKAHRPVALVRADATLVTGLQSEAVFVADDPEAAVRWMESEIGDTGSRD
jgi:uncharacterized protein (TIGR00725 family)